VAVARDHLGRDWLGGQAHLLGDVLFDARVDVGERADGAGDGAGGDFLACRDQPLLAAVELGISLREFQTEGHGLGVDRVRTADRRRHLVLEGAPLQRREQGIDVVDENVGGADELHVEAGVEHVRRGHALMHEARFGSDDLGQMRQERDHVVLRLAFDLVDPRDVEGCVFGFVPDRLCGALRYDAELGKRVGGMCLDLEPDAESRLWLPDGSHFRSGITGNHGRGFLA
jgi:hypothetical protein